MVHDIKAINGIDDERRNAIHYLIANKYTMPEYEKQELIKKYDIKESELDVINFISANDTQPKISKGAQLIRENPILKYLLGY